MAKGLHDLLALDHLVDQGGLLTAHGALALEILVAALGKEAATTRLSGVMQTTTSVMGIFSLSMNSRVPRMVSTPLNSWVKPMSRPSAKVSTSATMRLTISPEGWLSR